MAIKFKVRDIKMSTGGPLIAILNKDDALNLGIIALDRIKLKKGKKEAIAAINISEDHKDIKKGEIGLFDEILKELNAKNNSIIKFYFEPKPKALEYIKKKLDGKILNKKEIDEIIGEVVDNTLTQIELTYFIAACYMHPLTDKEEFNLTQSIIKHGNKLKLRNNIILDKHCIGGIPNNRTSMIMVPILAAAGYVIPKTSSRAITSPSGTADTMESLANVNFSVKKIKRIIQKIKACIVWGGAIDLASADDRLIQLRYPLRLDPEGMIQSSILAKKAAVSATHVIIDIPVGKTAKITNMRDAKKLQKSFCKLGRRLHIKTKAIITDGSQPIGNGVGPNLEARDVLYILRRDKQAPKDLEDKSLYLTKELLKLVGIKKKKEKIKNILESGLAYKKFKQIIKAQGGNPNVLPSNLKVGPYSYTLKTKRNCKIKKINNNLIARLARLAGAPTDKSAGLYLYVHNNQNLKPKDKIITIYSKNKNDLKSAKEFLINNKEIIKFIY